MGLITSIQDYTVALLSGKEAGSQGVITWFNEPFEIPVTAERVKSVFQTLNEAESASVALSISVATVVGKGALNQVRDDNGKRLFWFKEIIVIVHCIENPDVNMSGVTAYDVAEAVGFFLSPCELVKNCPLMLESIKPMPDPVLRVCNAAFSMEAGFSGPPARPHR